MKVHCDPGASPFIARYFEDCVYDTRDLVGFLLGLSSIAFWFTAQMPQLITNARRQRADALSPWFLAQWLLGDTCNLLGCLLKGDQLRTVLFTAQYFVCIDAILMVQFLYYTMLQHRRERARAVARVARHKRHRERRLRRLAAAAVDGGGNAAITAADLMSPRRLGSGGTDDLGRADSELSDVDFGGRGALPPPGRRILAPGDSDDPDELVLVEEGETGRPAHAGHEVTFRARAASSTAASAAAAAAAAAAAGSLALVGSTGLARRGAGGSMRAMGGGGLASELRGGGWWTREEAEAASPLAPIAPPAALGEAAAEGRGSQALRRLSELAPAGVAETSHLRLAPAGVAGTSRLAVAASAALPAAPLTSLASLGPRSLVGGPVPLWQSRLAGALGYTSSVLYLSSRVSQVIRNAQRKTSEGLALSMFFVAVAANTAYGLSIIVRLRSMPELFAQLPWILGSLGTVGLDATILIQCTIYGSEPEAGSDAEREARRRRRREAEGGGDATGDDVAPGRAARRGDREDAPLLRERLVRGADPDRDGEAAGAEG